MAGMQDGYIDILDNNLVFNASQAGAYGYMREYRTLEGYFDSFDMAIVFNIVQQRIGMNNHLRPGKKWIGISTPKRSLSGLNNQEQHV
jgi:hypothetical protein